MRRPAVIGVLCALVLAACSGSGVVKIKDPGSVPNMTTTTALDLSGVGLNGVNNRTTTSIPLSPGGATLSGTVAGPDGGVDGAVVHVERLVGTGTGSVDLQTAADGTWTLPTILGGRYRVRAWRAPDLALTKPEVFYLQSSETKTLNLRLDRYSGGAVTASMAPDPPTFGAQVNLFVLVTEKTVDSGGVVRGVPVVGAGADLSGNGYQVETANPATTDSNGVAQWRLRCTTLGQGSLSVTVANGASFPLTIPTCVDSGASTTTSSTSVTPSTSSRRTTSTR